MAKKSKESRGNKVKLIMWVFVIASFFLSLVIEFFLVEISETWRKMGRVGYGLSLIISMTLLSMVYWVVFLPKRVKKK